MTVCKTVSYADYVMKFKNGVRGPMGSGNIIQPLKGGSVRIEPSRQLLDDCNHERNSKRKVGKLKSSFHQLSKNRHFKDIE